MVPWLQRRKTDSPWESCSYKTTTSEANGGCAQYRYDPLRCWNHSNIWHPLKHWGFLQIGHVAASPCKRVPLQQLRCARRTHLHCLFTVLVDGVGTTAESGSSDFWRFVLSALRWSQWYGFEDCFGSTDGVLHAVEKTILTRHRLRFWASDVLV